MTTREYDIAMVGLGVMGGNLALNLADHGFSVVGFDLDPQKAHTLELEAQDRPIVLARTLASAVDMLRKPRVIMLLVPAGKVVDAVLGDLTTLLEPGDIVLDAGNSFFKDTEERYVRLRERGLHFFGVGVSGGSAGARSGPSIMPGGDRGGYPHIAPMLEAVAASVAGEPCVAYLGPRGAGHYVKMVHNGIEYGLMRIIAETYDLMKRGLQLDHQQLHDVYAQWNEGELKSFLLEITADIFTHIDEHTGRPLIDMILDEARQKGTGMWTSTSAMELHVPVPTIDIAVASRDLSVPKKLREAISQILSGPSLVYRGKKDFLLQRLGGALHAGMVITYAQGMALLARASQEYGYGLKLDEVARIWRGGCIIRSALLEHIRAAYARRPDLPDLMMDEHFAAVLHDRQQDLRTVAATSAELGIPSIGFMSCLAYLDSFRSGWSQANLIQAQRDYFGAHTYERIDLAGVFHTEWGAKR